MVKQTDIFTAINELLVVAHPDYTVYIQACPEKFTRPSFLLEMIKISRTDICRMSIEKTAYFTITCFTSIDEYYRSDPEELVNLQEDILQIFNRGYVTIGDRAIKVKSSGGGADTDRTYIDLQFEYVDNRTDEEDQTPLIATVTTKIKEV